MTNSPGIVNHSHPRFKYIKLGKNLDLNRCPYCNVDTPNLVFVQQHNFIGTDDHGRVWGIYKCVKCAGMVIATNVRIQGQLHEFYPKIQVLDESIPDRAKKYLYEAINTVHSPSASVVVCNSSVDAMLKELGYTDGSIYHRIEEATANHYITEDMRNWAHTIRISANEQRHSDLDSELPTMEDAKQLIEFAETLAMILFVLPSRINSGISNVEGGE